MTSDGLLTVAAGWPNGSGDRVTYRLDEGELALIVDRLRWTFDRAGDLEPVYHAAKEDHLVLRVRVDGRLFYMHCSQFIDWDPRFGGERWQEVYRYRLIWHAFKDILEQMVIEAAFRDHGQLPSRTRAATSQPTTRRSQPLVALAYSSGAMPSPDAPRSAGVLELWEDGRLIVSPDWHCGAGERMLFHLTEVQFSELIARLKQPVEAAGPLKAPMDFGHHSSYHSLRIRAGSVRFDMLTAQPWHLTDPPHSEDSQKWRETYRNRVLWHELKDVLQHAVIDIVLPEAVKPE